MHTDSSATHLDRRSALVPDSVQKRMQTVYPLLHRLLRICSLRGAVVYDSAAVKTLARRTASLPSDHRNWISKATVIIGIAGGRRQISFEMLSPIRSMQIA
ncbi:hypothetical protein SNOG_14518 [Parastagonospora nodorum SN15]|uniref:Uncharacterized protein n=1 Tax=Phaeosphaeria nodorum (strain SN15 / ATCC MYA-4574 / FGSC 10173) TaxID=321614 RepID=Q0U0Z8_PHANO|nr:hypothetical protein SNOG_14518 [Parastagonospora nodorum SN15]EAT78058.1 hypothetical protein SNOG_14518 [Parastagonospora nodorum SN15]